VATPGWQQADNSPSPEGPAETSAVGRPFGARRIGFTHTWGCHPRLFKGRPSGAGEDLALAAVRTAPALADLSSRKDLRSTLPVLLALLEKALQKSLSFGRAAKGSDRIRRHGDHEDDFPFIDPQETISLVDLIPLADSRRNVRLALFGDSGFHRVLLGEF
jgi:hypothetical protein